jgi:hypothetical protein
MGSILGEPVDGTAERSVDSIIERGARSILSVAPAVTGAALADPALADAAAAGRRGYFTPEEDDRLRACFARYLTARAGLLQTIDELRPAVFESGSHPSQDRLRTFAIAYCAACLLVRAGRFIVEKGSADRVLRRKLDEAAPAFGTPRKMFTQVYRSVTSPRRAWQMLDASRFADESRPELLSLRADPCVGPVVDLLLESEPAARVRLGDLARARIRYRVYSWRRRHVSAFRKAMFALFEASGRVIADMRNPFHHKRVTPAIRAEIESILRPGDVLITRHDDAMSNLFLPGFWPHAALHVGTADSARSMGVELHDAIAVRWTEPRRVLEARKDGVLLRALDDTLAVDSVAIIRPRLTGVDLARGLARALAHEGKLYDFEFDFTRSDRLVCTEVVYRAYDGLGDLRIDLCRRAGRMTCSAEDLLDRAIAGNGFEPVAVFGVPGRRGVPEAGGCDRLATGSDVTSILRRSYRDRPESDAPC